MKALILPVTRATWASTKGYELRDVPAPVLDEKRDAEDAQRVLIEPIYAGVCGTDKGIWFRKAFREAILHHLDSDKRPYFVMGHEVAHVLQRHQTRAYQARLVDGVDSVENLSKFISQSSKPDIGTVVGYATALKHLLVNFSEQQELQADSCALRIMAARYPDLKHLQPKMQQVLQRMGMGAATTAQKGPASAGVLDQIQYLSNGAMESHPSSHERRNNVETVMRVMASGNTATAPVAPGVKKLNP